MGLHLMNYRAKIVGGSLEVQRGPTGRDRGDLFVPSPGTKECSKT